MKKRLICIILAIVLMMGILPLSTLASGTDDSQAKIKKTYEETGAYIKELCEKNAPIVSSTGGEWAIIGLARSEIGTKVIYDSWYQNVVNTVESKINAKEQLHTAKSTENERVIVALTAAGYDVTNVAGHNLLAGLTDMTYLKRQGINGPIWGLIAFDTYGYDIPEDVNGGTQATRDALIEYILSKRLATGGWALSGTASDPDITGMAIQALAPYYKTNESVKTAVDEALITLSEIQKENGGYASWNTVNSESCAQVIVALTALGIDPHTDARFVKNGTSVVDALCSFAVEGGGFKHTADGSLNGMATEQGFYAMASYIRFKEGKTSLYDMKDAFFAKDLKLINENGNNFIWSTDSADDVILHINAPFNSFISLKIDGLEVSNENYVVNDGSIIVSIKNAYLKTLEAGNKSIEVVTDYGVVPAELIIENAKIINSSDETSIKNFNTITAVKVDEKIADTADENSIVAVCFSTLVSAAGAAYVVSYKKKQEN